MNKKFFISKLTHEGMPKLEYKLCNINLNELLGCSIKIEFTGKIECINCSRKIKKTFNQGHCFPCAQSLARCDMCILRPETCHFAKGTCREPEWGEENCMIKHVVYLANTTGLKVGVTREHQKLTRWGDQGAVEVVVLAEVPTRLDAGLMEASIKKSVNDKTNWRSLITGKISEVALIKEKQKIVKEIDKKFKKYLIEDDTLYNFKYPVIKYPEKSLTHNFDKESILEGEFQGIRGQYMFVAGKAVNIRKYQGYEIVLT